MSLAENPDLQLYMIDASSPFFISHPESIINWSKVPFEEIEIGGKLKKKTYKAIKKKFQNYISAVRQMGYNAISIDDVCHMVLLDIYQEKLKKKIKRYQGRFKKLFALEQMQGLKVYVTTDIMFFNEDITLYLQENNNDYLVFLAQVFNQLFDQMPEIDGVIIRIGEADGIDVVGDFKSDIIIKTAPQANRLIKALLPVFEKHNKLFIFRTWTIGAYQVGDLNWNSQTYEKAFADIESDKLIVSMKPGEGDFFRYLEVNEQFFQDKRHKKLIELQTRREYEGFGEIPNFLGWEHHRLALELSHAEQIVGIHVWCQTGGWSNFRNFSYTRNSSFFNELNTNITIQIFKNKLSVEQALDKYLPGLPQSRFLEYLRLAEEVVEELLYDPYFAENKLYFNRSRIPPLLYVFWGFVTISVPIAAIFQYYVKEPQKGLRKADSAFTKIARMKQLNKQLNFPYNTEFFHDTFELLLMVRKYLYTGNLATYQLIHEKLTSYNQLHPSGYQFKVQKLSPVSLKMFKLLIPIIIRRNKSYRLLDGLLFNALTAKVYNSLLKRYSKNMPDFANKKAMPLDKLLT